MPTSSTAAPDLCIYGWCSLVYACYFLSFISEARKAQVFARLDERERYIIISIFVDQGVFAKTKTIKMAWQTQITSVSVDNKVYVVGSTVSGILNFGVSTSKCWTEAEQFRWKQMNRDSNFGAKSFINGQRAWNKSNN